MMLSRITTLTKVAINAGSAFVVCALLIHAACSRSTPHQPVRLKLEPLTLPAAEPSLAPQLTVNGDSAILSWIETQGQTSLLKFAQRTASGWSEPRTAASGTDWFVNSADVPSVVRLDDGTLAAHWLQNTDVASEAYDVRIAFSKDAGVTWTSPVSPHHDGHQDRARVRFAVPGAWRRTRPRLARRTGIGDQRREGKRQHEPAGGGVRSERRATVRVARG